MVSGGADGSLDAVAGWISLALPEECLTTQNEIALRLLSIATTLLIRSYHVGIRETPAPADAHIDLLRVLWGATDPPLPTSPKRNPNQNLERVEVLCFPVLLLVATLPALCAAYPSELPDVDVLLGWLRKIPHQT
jgi:hypothetical protein